MLVNGTDLTTIGFDLTTGLKHHSSPRRKLTTQIIPAIPGLLKAGAEVVEARTVTLNGLLRGTSAANFQARLEELTWRLQQPGTALAQFNDQGATQIVLEDMDPGGADEKVLLVFDTSVVVSLPDPAFAVSGPTQSKLVLTFQLLYPYALTTAADSVTGITATYTDIPLGTAPVLGVFQIDGAATTPQLRYRPDGGTGPTETMDFNTLAGGESYTVDMSARTIVGAGGAPVNSLPELTGGDFFSLDPKDGAWPIVSNSPECSVSAGTLRVDYHMAWLV